MRRKRGKAQRWEVMGLVKCPCPFLTHSTWVHKAIHLYRLVVVVVFIVVRETERDRGER